MIISERQRRELDAYIMALEKFCAYSINEKISSFWKIATKPRLIAEWRKTYGHRSISEGGAISYLLSEAKSRDYSEPKWIFSRFH